MLFKKRKGSLGRVAVLKSLILSKLVHLWILLPNLLDDFVNKLQKNVFCMICNQNQNRISRKTVVTDVNDGGLGLPLNVFNFIVKVVLDQETPKHKS